MPGALILTMALAASSCTEASADVLWYLPYAGRELRPFFLPESVLRRARDPEALPFSDDARRRIAENVRLAKEKRERPEAYEDEPYCDGPIQGDVVCPDDNLPRNPSGDPRIDAIRDSPLVFLGEVRQTAAGVTEEAHLETLVCVRVCEVLAGSAIRAGDERTYLQDTGSLTFAGERLCTEDPGEPVPRIGDRVVVAGEPDDANPGHLWCGHYRVIDGRIRLPRDAALDERWIAVDELRLAVRSARGGLP